MQQPHDEATQSIISRLQRIEGQVRGIRKMVADGRDTLDVLIQISAVLAATRRVGAAVTNQRLTEIADPQQPLTPEAVQSMQALIEAFTKLD